MSAIACPKCGETDGFESIEQVICTADVDGLEADSDGNVLVAWGGTNYMDGTQTTVGLRCVCGWRHEGTQDTWAEALFPKPDIAGMLATRQRMKNRKPEDTP